VPFPTVLVCTLSRRKTALCQHHARNDEHDVRHDSRTGYRSRRDLGTRRTAALARASVGHTRHHANNNKRGETGTLLCCNLVLWTNIMLNSLNEV
jgi:hypothetical protein